MMVEKLETQREIQNSKQIQNPKPETWNLATMS